jgi:hypothetical protein
VPVARLAEIVAEAWVAQLADWLRGLGSTAGSRIGLDIGSHIGH